MYTRLDFISILLLDIFYQDIFFQSCSSDIFPMKYTLISWGSKQKHEHISLHGNKSR